MEKNSSALYTALIKHALPGRSPKELRALSEQWRPWRSDATISLWNSLEQREV